MPGIPFAFDPPCTKLFGYTLCRLLFVEKLNFLPGPLEHI